MSRRTVLTILPGILLSFGVTQASDSFFSIDFPGAVSTGVNTHLFGINARSDVVGSYTCTDGKVHGYLLSGGTFTTIDFPGSTGSQAVGGRP